MVTFTLLKFLIKNESRLHLRTNLFKSCCMVATSMKGFKLGCILMEYWKSIGLL